LILANQVSIKFTNYKNKEYLRAFFLILGLVWILLIWISEPQFNNSVNDLWLLWVVSVQIISALILFSLAYLEQKMNAKILFFLLGVAILLLNEELLEIPNASRLLVIKTSGTILGTIMGLVSGILIWFYTIQKLHSLEEDLEMDEELNQEEKELLLTKLNNDLEWLKNSEVGDKNE
jgi:putative effector of murein hydrolase